MVSLLATHRCALTPARFAAAIATVALASGGYLIARAPADAALALAPASAGSAVEARCDQDRLADRRSPSLERHAKEHSMRCAERLSAITADGEPDAGQGRQP